MSERELEEESLAEGWQGPDQSDGVGARERPSVEILGWIGGWSAILALALWLAKLTPIWLTIVVAGSALWTVAAFRPADARRLFSALLLWVAVGVSVGTQYRLSKIVSDWESLQRRVEDSSAEALDGALNSLIDQGDMAVSGVAEAAQDSAPGGRRELLFERLNQVQRNTGVSAVALFAQDGSAVAWAGEHRGSIPIEAWQGARSYIFHEGPLFTYLYFARPLETGQIAMAAFLLESSVELGDGELSFSERFDRRHGARPRFCSADQVCATSVWDWGTENRGTVLSVSFDNLTQPRWWERVVKTGRRIVGLAGLLALLSISTTWYRSRTRRSDVPIVVGTAALIIAPIGKILDSATPLFNPTLFVVPGPRDVTLGIVLIFLCGGSLWLLTRTARSPGRSLPVWLAIPGMVVLFPLALEVIDHSVSSAVLSQRPAGGFAVQLATAMLIGIPLFLLMRAARGFELPRHRAALLRGLGYLLPAVLGMLVLVAWRPERGFPLAAAAVWALPATLLVISRPRLASSRSNLRLWLASGWLAGTAALAFLWPLHVQAQLANAEREVALLGIKQDRYLEVLLDRFAQQAKFLSFAGETGVNLLYHSWAVSGLAREGYEARIGLWRGGNLERELNLSATEQLSPAVRSDVLAPRTGTLIRHYGGVDSLHYLLLADLPDGGTISVAVPPHRRIGAATPLARLLDPNDAGTSGEVLYLVPLEAGTLTPDHLAKARADTIQWIRESRWWRSETLIRMPEGLVHAHLDVATPGPALLTVRAAILQARILGVLLLIWLLARSLGRDLAAVPFIQPGWIRSFRGRLSVSLFIFFLLPTLVFGAVSYKAVAREVVQSSAALAQQALDEAAARIPVPSVAQLGGPTGADLLLYSQGTLARATAAEVLELGLFHTWLTPNVYLPLAMGEDVQKLEERRVGQSEYLVAYRRLDANNVLAAPIPLDADEITRRQQEFRDVAILVVLLGLGLSIVLALMVSRALARPLDELSGAALTVGGGNLRTRLPETRSDEFGSVYTSFNRMIGNLQSTRAALEQETRRTETIVAEAATGVLALDALGRVELINPRAAEILGMPIVPGDPLLASKSPYPKLSAAISELWRSPSAEAGAELDLDGRVVRLRLRRLTAREDGGGAVVAVEDLTSEVRTARVLAWGEMARQVAHEIKNPLTPIKLAVQHVRRAFFDQRADFGDILERNVEAILREIDRLGDIARAFSRFGTPAAASSELEEVDVTQAIEETLDLYGGGEGGAVFHAELPAEPLPRVIAREDELKEVLVNLLENAREAVNGGGEIVVSASYPSVPPAGANGDTGQEWISVAVTDTGVGIPEDQLPKIFEPHFSTRSSGTGLGLAIVRRIADSWGAEIRVESAVGRGTRIELLMRAANGADQQKDADRQKDEE